MKRLGKYISIFILIGLIGFSAYFIYWNTLNPCKKVLRYSLGRFDTQFGISKEQFKSYIAESEKVWEKALGRELFVYDSNADFKINLIYDERQLATIQKQKTEFGLSAIEQAFKKLDAEFNVFKKNYESESASYEKALSIFNERRAVYETEVKKWNSRGGAPKDQFENLESERQYLNTEASRLNSVALSLNNMATELNVLLKERNAKAVEYNKVARAYNEKYKGGMEFNQAEYIGNPYTQNGEINVYQFNSKNDLVLALSHEFGHALGLDHVENPGSLMYYLTGAGTETAPTLSGEDLAELNKMCEM